MKSLQERIYVARWGHVMEGLRRERVFSDLNKAKTWLWEQEGEPSSDAYMEPGVYHVIRDYVLDSSTVRPYEWAFDEDGILFMRTHRPE